MGLCGESTAESRMQTLSGIATNLSEGGTLTTAIRWCWNSGLCLGPYFCSASSTLPGIPQDVAVVNVKMESTLYAMLCDLTFDRV